MASKLLLACPITEVGFVSSQHVVDADVEEGGQDAHLRVVEAVVPVGGRPALNEHAHETWMSWLA
ncbi:hypothetical protein [Streptomyces sp. NPDC001658]